MANYPEKVILIAKQEEGYLEKSKSAYKKDPSVLDRKTDGAGKDNYTKYGRDMHNIYPSVMDFPAYWCDAFVDWCFYKAYGVTTAKSLLCGNFDDYTVASASMYEKHGALGTTPKYGAQVFFTRNGKVSGCYHTGLVTNVDSKYFYTTEGNTSGASSVISNGGGVKAKKYKITDYKGKVIFGYPKYDEKESEKKEKEKRKTAIVKASSLFVRNASGSKIGFVKKGDKIDVLKENATKMKIDGTVYTMSKIKYRSEAGYVAKKYLDF